MQVSISAYDNFVNSINSEQTKEQYEYCLKQFLKFCQMDLDSFLKLPQDEIPNLIVNYLLQRRFAEMKITDIKIPTDRVLMDVDHRIIDTVKIVSFIIGLAIAIYILFSWQEIIESYDSIPDIVQTNFPHFLLPSIIVAFTYLFLQIFWDRIRDFLKE